MHIQNQSICMDLNIWTNIHQKTSLGIKPFIDWVVQKHSHMLISEIKEPFPSNSRCLGYILTAESTDWLFFPSSNPGTCCLSEATAAPLVSLEELPKGAATYMNLCSCLLCLVWSTASWTCSLCNHCCIEAAVYLQDLQQDLTVGAIDNGKKQIFFCLFFFFWMGRGEGKTIFHLWKHFSKLLDLFLCKLICWVEGGGCGRKKPIVECFSI